MARSYNEPEAISQARSLLENTLRHLDEAGLGLTAAYVDMARHCLEKEFLRVAEKGGADLGKPRADSLNMRVPMASDDTNLQT